VRLVVAIALAAGAVALSATSAPAGATQGASHGHLRFIRHVAHVAHARRVSTARRTRKVAPLNCVFACPAYESTINQYFTDVAAANGALDNVYSVATQYSSIQSSETFAGAYVDGNPYPTGTHNCHDGIDTYCVTDQQLMTEIGKVIKTNGWPTSAQSQTALYFIFLPANVGVCGDAGSPSGLNPCTTNVFCAYHASASTFLYAVEPDAAAVSGGACDPLQHPAGNGADATINTVSHEQIEAMTDPTGTGWISNSGDNPEIGDLCAYDFGTPLGTAGTEYNQVINGHNYFLQLEYSNAANSNAGGCVPYLGGPVTPANPRNGSGPLVYQGGSVMTTNTVYAIYWIAATPVNSKVPTISGTPKVGRRLAASPGTWANLPKFTYKWLRCSPAGTSCKGISMATSRTHVLVAADARHKIEVQVTGSNTMGNAIATSAPTAAVTK
jgi:hypothetical protein